MEGFIGEIKLFGGNFPPRTWAFCEGQLLAIASNTALFSILGTMYGGDGRTTFALPDLRGRCPIGIDTGPGLTPRRQGSRGGEETHVLNQLEIPSHNHSISGTATGTLMTNATAATSTGPNNKLLAEPTKNIYTTDTSTLRYLKAGSVTVDTFSGTTIFNTGGSREHNNMMPWLAIPYIICQFGIFPSRN